METMITEVAGDPAVTVLAISGAVDVGPEELGRLSQVLDGLVAEGVRYLVVDLSGTEFLVSRALGELLTATVRLRSRGRDMAIAGASGAVAAAARKAGVGGMIQLRETVEAAVEAVVQRQVRPVPRSLSENRGNAGDRCQWYGFVKSDARK